MFYSLNVHTIPSTEQEIDKLQNESEILKKLLSEKKLDGNHYLLKKSSFPENSQIIKNIFP